MFVAVVVQLQHHDVYTDTEAPPKAAVMSRSTTTSSAATGVTASSSRSVSAKSGSNPLPPSDVKLYVTNLRLLDLDLRPDWPGITVQTFSSRNADQKQRIGGVEWSLFRLFELWDPNETSQVQSMAPFNWTVTDTS